MALSLLVGALEAPASEPVKYPELIVAEQWGRWGY